MKESCKCGCCGKNALGLTLGIFAGVAHLVWMVLVYLGWAKPMVDWILKMHHVEYTWNVLPFDLVNGLLLVLMTFVGGYVLGWLLSTIFCLFSGCCKK